VKVKFAPDCIGDDAVEMSNKLQPGEVLLLENLRFYGEEKKGDEAFAKRLAELADCYVNDAFGTAHRAHASTAIIAQYFGTDKKMFGHLINNELAAMDKALKEPQRPFTAVLGGAKVSDKIMVITQLLDKVDNLIIGGGMAYTFVKAQGGQIGNSLLEEDRLETAKEIMAEAEKKGVNIYLPSDNVVADKFENDANTQTTAIDEVPDGYMGLDIGPESVREFTMAVKNSKTVLWNGPMGVFEMENFQKGTIEVAKSLADATSAGAYTLVGGGDSVAAINKFDLASSVSYVSTGGGAMLEYLEGKELPGIKAIRG
jgi:phosphoglycerate kinase